MMNPDDKQVLLMLAWLFLQHGQTDKAAALCEEIHEQEPENPVAAAILANIYLQNAEPQMALDVLKAASFPSDMARPVALLEGQALIAQGRQAEAKARWQKYLTQKHV
ncbi:MAG: tetratricopeptide repeat protein [Victivallales bacterium]|nr:tetratricopeptide repeat protein [Victivallales bacterium]